MQQARSIGECYYYLRTVLIETFQLTVKFKPEATAMAPEKSNYVL